MNVEKAFEYIQYSAAAGRLAQAYVIVAPPRGAGQMLVERVLGLLFCNAAEDIPCGACRGCVSVREQTTPDVLWIEPEKKSRTIAIEQIRAIQKTIYESAFSGGWKACVIVGADCMSAQAANALLKALEEPPEKTLFLLLTDSPQRLLPTIISRCQRMMVTGSHDDGLDDGLRDAVRSVLSASAGVLGVERLARADRFVALLKDVRATIEAEEREAVKAAQIEIEDKTLDARISSRYREQRQAIIRSILLWYRDILMLQCGADEGLVQHRAALPLLRKRAAEVSYREAMSHVQIIETINQQLGMNMPEGLVFTAGFGALT